MEVSCDNKSLLQHVLLFQLNWLLLPQHAWLLRKSCFHSLLGCSGSLLVPFGVYFRRYTVVVASTVCLAVTEVFCNTRRLIGCLHSGIAATEVSCDNASLLQHVLPLLDVSTAYGCYGSLPIPFGIYLRRYIVVADTATSTVAKGCSLAWGLAPSIHISLS